MRSKGESTVVAVCTGCEKRSDELWPWNDPEEVKYIGHDVTGDGTYSKGKFVCDECYNALIDRRLEDFQPDIGTPEEVQQQAYLMRFEKKPQPE